MNLEEKIKAVIRNVPDFPKKGIMFKDITPVFENQQLCSEITDGFIKGFGDTNARKCKDSMILDDCSTLRTECQDINSILMKCRECQLARSGAI